METFIINVSNKSVAKDLELFLSKYGNSTKHIKLGQPESLTTNTSKKENNFFDIVGLWEGTDISIEKIREKAWRKI
jgi:hypothetical protein